MTDPTPATAPPPTAQAAALRLLRSLPLRPAEGWITLVASAVMAMTFALSISSAGWVFGGQRSSGYMPWVALAGFAAGLAGAKLGWGRWRTHVVGALLAGLLLPLLVGGIILEGSEPGLDPAGLALRFHATYDVAYGVWQDLAVQGRQFTSQFAHWHLILGAIIWAAGQLTAYSVFGHRRPLDAVVSVGLVTLGNMALTARDPATQLNLLVLFSSAALLLLIRTHVFEEEVTWVRRRIGDPSVVGRLYLRGGTAFVALAIVGSVALTASASSAPLQGMWSDLPARLQAMTQWLAKFAPPNGDLRGPGTVSFSDNPTTRGVWQPGSGIAFRAQLSNLETQPFKWRVGTLTDYTNDGWSTGTVRSIDAVARAPLLKGAADAPTTDGRREVRVRIVPDGFRQPIVVGPASLEWVDRTAQGLVVGNAGWFARVESTDPLNSYSISALVPEYKDVPGGITEARLRYAGTEYPAELVSIFTALPQGAMGPEAAKLLTTIKGLAATTEPKAAPAGNAYDLAKTMEAYLRNPANFRYDPDVRDQRQEQCGGVSTVECFAIIRAGYCEFYASTMAVLLRASGVPARIAYGFLGGERQADGSETVSAESAHWWVEVYFPVAGWVEFDPTGGGVGRPQAIPSGSIGPATPKPSRSLPAATIPDPGGDGRSNPPPAGGGNGGPNAGPFIAIAAILLAGFGVLMFTAWRRAPRRPMHPDQAWGSLGRLAARFGLGPRPSQTVFEYAGVLGDAVPGARPELTTIANAKVEVAYGRGSMGVDRLRSIGAAYGRLRLALLGVVLRRGMRRGRSRRR